MHLSKLQSDAWEIADAKGFHIGHNGGRTDTLLRLCLVHTEISEATQEAKRHGNSGAPVLTGEHLDKFGEELADAVIRILDLAETVGVNLEEAICTKMNINSGRNYMYGTPQEEK